MEIVYICATVSVNIIPAKFYENFLNFIAGPAIAAASLEQIDKLFSNLLNRQNQKLMISSCRNCPSGQSAAERKKTCKHL